MNKSDLFNPHEYFGTKTKKSPLAAISSEQGLLTFLATRAHGCFHQPNTAVLQFSFHVFFRLLPIIDRKLVIFLFEHVAEMAGIIIANLLGYFINH